MPALKFSRLAPDDLERVRGFASDRFGRVMQRTAAQIESRWMDEMAQLLQEETTLCLVAEMGPTVCGLAVCTPLPWESKLLEKSMWGSKYLAVNPKSADASLVARDLVAAINGHLMARAADFLLCKTAATEPVMTHALETNGFLLMDTLLDFTYDCRLDRTRKDAAPPAPDGFVLRLATAEDSERLALTARASFTEHFGRFHADPRIGRANATRIYEEWIRSCAHGWADWVYVLMHGERVAGYSAWKKPSAVETQYACRLGHYSIGAVHPDFSGRGLFQTLTRAGMAELCHSTDWIEGPTHLENHAVQRAYLRLGWQMVGAQHSFHKWLQG